MFSVSNSIEKINILKNILKYCFQSFEKYSLIDGNLKEKNHNQMSFQLPTSKVKIKNVAFLLKMLENTMRKLFGDCDS